jgi:hypothetical protein
MTMLTRRQSLQTLSAVLVSSAAIRKYTSRLLFLHLKDVRARTPEPAAREQRRYQFVELGQGRGLQECVPCP